MLNYFINVFNLDIVDCMFGVQKCRFLNGIPSTIIVDQSPIQVGLQQLLAWQPESPNFPVDVIVHQPRVASLLAEV
jgi:hypothetical protein